MTPAESILYRNYPDQRVRCRGLLDWHWSIRDGMCGPLLAEGHTETGWGARRQVARAMARCVRWTPQHDLDLIVERLHAEGIDVEAHYDDRQRVCVRPLCPCSDLDHRRVMAAFFAIAGAVCWEVA